MTSNDIKARIEKRLNIASVGFACLAFSIMFLLLSVGLGLLFLSGFSAANLIGFFISLELSNRI